MAGAFMILCENKLMSLPAPHGLWYSDASSKLSVHTTSEMHMYFKHLILPFLILLQWSWGQQDDFWRHIHEKEGELGPEVATSLLRRAKGSSQMRKGCSVCEVGAPSQNEAEGATLRTESAQSCQDFGKDWEAAANTVSLNGRNLVTSFGSGRFPLLWVSSKGSYRPSAKPQRSKALTLARFLSFLKNHMVPGISFLVSSTATDTTGI